MVKRHHRPVLSRVQAAAGIILLLLFCMVLIGWLIALSGRGWVFSSLGEVGLELGFSNQRVALWIYRGFPSTNPAKLRRGPNSQRYDFDPVRFQYAGEGVGRMQGVGGLVLYRGHTNYRAITGENDFTAFWHLLIVPVWMLLLALGVWPAYWIALPLRRERLIRRRRKLGLCESCGYDLRGGGERCPECGTETPSRAAVYSRPEHAAGRSGCHVGR